MELLTLNDDVLEDIIVQMNPRSAKLFSTTCRRARIIALPRVLAYITLGKNTDPRTVSEFCAFMLSDTPRRPGYVRRLKLLGSAFLVGDKRSQHTGPPLRTILLMSKFLEHTTALHEIDIRNAEDLLRVGTPLKDALSTLPALKSITLDDKTLPWFPWGHLQSLPERLKIVVTNVHSGHVAAFQSAMAQPFARSLVSLDVGASVLNAWTEIRVLPSLRKLSVWPGTLNRVSHLCQNFPNLTYLDVMAEVPVSSAHAHWPSLDNLRLPGYDYHCSIPIASHIRRVHIVHFNVSHRSLIERISPVVLVIGASQYHFDFKDLAIIPTSVKYLHIHPMFVPDEVSSLSDHLKRHPLIGLCITYKLWRARSQVGEIQFASEIAAFIPTLLYVGLVKHVTMELGQSSFQSRWFRVISRDSKRQVHLDALTEEAGERIEQQLLNLS